MRTTTVFLSSAQETSSFVHVLYSVQSFVFSYVCLSEFGYVFKKCFLQLRGSRQVSVADISSMRMLVFLEDACCPSRSNSFCFSNHRSGNQLVSISRNGILMCSFPKSIPAVRLNCCVCVLLFSEATDAANSLCLASRMSQLTWTSLPRRSSRFCARCHCRRVQCRVLHLYINLNSYRRVFELLSAPRYS